MHNNTPHNISKLINRIHAGSMLDTYAMLDNYLEYVRQKLDASIVSWVCAYHGKYVDEVWKAELLDGWKVMDLALPKASGIDRETAKENYFQVAKTQGVSLFTQLALQQTGNTRTHRYVDVVATEHEKANHRLKSEYMASQNVEDRMLGIYHLDAEAESYLIVDRPPGAEAFSKAEEDILMNCLIEFPRLHYWLFLERGLLQNIKRPNSPRQKELIPLLLSGIPEKQMADKLGLSQSTVHGYILDIYRNYSVRSRAELNNLWIMSL